MSPCGWPCSSISSRPGLSSDAPHLGRNRRRSRRGATRRRPRRRRRHRRRRPGHRRRGIDDDARCQRVLRGSRVRRPPRPPPRTGPRRCRDDRDRQPGRRPRRLHGGGGDAQHRPTCRCAQRCRVRPRRRRASGTLRRVPERDDHHRPRRRATRPVRRAGRGRRPPVHRRRIRCAEPPADAPGDGVRRRPRRRPRPALRGQCPHRWCRDARGAVLQRARPSGLASTRRGADGPP